MRDFIVRWWMALWFFLLGVSLCYFFVLPHRINYRTHWHEPTYRGASRWMSQDATIDIYMPWDATMQVGFKLQSYQRRRTLRLLVNGVEHSQHEVAPVQPTRLVVLSHLAQGINTFTFHAEEGCEPVWEDGVLHCYSFELSNLDVNQVQAVEVAEDLVPAMAKTADVIWYDEGWFDQEHDGEHTWRWMTDRATLRVFGNRSGQRDRLVEVKLRSSHNARTLQVHAGDKILFEGAIPTSLTTVHFPLPAEPRDTTLAFVSKDGCERPSQIEGSRSLDARCLSFSVERITIQQNAP